jgi:tRNA pseudouridine38-40 synthase
MRFFLEVSYKGTAYSGFQSQKNANTIQSEVEKAFRVLQKSEVELIGSSRTDAGVHALQNYFHFDFDGELHEQFVYKMNAILPGDIVVKRVMKMDAEAHCRFDAVSRLYRYYIYRRKDPFLKDRAYYFPYKLDMDLMKKGAKLIKKYEDFTSFSKRNTQVKTFRCKIEKSKWIEEDGCLVYEVRANRFLRGMVRALTATLLRVGTKKISIDEFKKIIEARECTLASFAVPAQGLFLVEVEFPGRYFK